MKYNVKHHMDINDRYDRSIDTDDVNEAYKTAALMHSGRYPYTVTIDGQVAYLNELYIEVVQLKYSQQEA